MTLNFVWFYVRVNSSQAARNYFGGRTCERLLRRMYDFANSLEASVLNDSTFFDDFCWVSIVSIHRILANCDGIFCVERGAFDRIR